MKPRNIKTKILIILISLIIIVAILAVLFFFTDIFRTKKGAFFRYFKMLEPELQILNITDFDEYKNVKQTMPYIRKAEMIVKSSSNIADSSIMDKLKLNMESKVNNETEKMNSSIIIKSSNKELFNVTFAKDKNNYAFYSPQISNAFIGIRNENLQKISNAIVGDTYVPNEIVEIKMDKLLEITDVEKRHIEDYYNLLKTSSPDTSYTKSSNKIKIRDKNYNATSYTLNLSGADSADVLINLLSKVSQDSIMMDFITSKFKLLNMSEEYTDINTLNIRMKEKIEELKSNSEKADKIEITVSEYRQKNIKTEIKVNDDVYSITHIEIDGKEILILGINEKSFEIDKEEKNYNFKYTYYTDDIEKSVEINYRNEGTIEENNISNIMEITTVNGIKKVTYSYKDTVNFTNDIGLIETFDENQSAILNNYPTEQISAFMKELKNKINSVYINAGASIGINLDPIFENFI